MIFLIDEDNRSLSFVVNPPEHIVKLFICIICKSAKNVIVDLGGIDSCQYRVSKIPAAFGQGNVNLFISSLLVCAEAELTKPGLYIKIFFFYDEAVMLHPVCDK